VPIGQGKAVYFEATAGEIPNDEIEPAMATFTRFALEQGGREWTAADVSGDARLRPYRAVVRQAYMLDAHDMRIAVELAPPH
jgi:hypothetical protein